METYEKIKQTAIIHFGAHGYKGTSLLKIAEDVGIKKPSLYAHFSSKQALFEACMESAMAELIEDIKILLNEEGKSGEQVLYRILIVFTEEAGSDSKRLFCLRFAYMPPEELGENRNRYSNEFIESLANMLSGSVKRFLEDRGCDPGKSGEAAEAYLCMFDGLMVELLFGGTKNFSKRLNAAWNVFVRGVR